MRTPEQEIEMMDKAVEAALEADREKSLRDVFATAALGSLIVATPNRPHYMVADDAYGYADAMLAARKQKP